MTFEFLFLRLIHVLGGIFWVGAGVYSAFFLQPALRTSGTPPGPLLTALAERKLFVILPAVALLTIASGLRLTWIVSAGFSSAYFSSATGRTFLVSGAAAVVAFLLSVVVSRPAAFRAAQLSAQAAKADGPDRARLSAEAAALQQKGGLAGTVAVTLLILAAAGMAVARYL